MLFSVAQGHSQTAPRISQKELRAYERRLEELEKTEAARRRITEFQKLAKSGSKTPGEKQPDAAKSDERASGGSEPEGSELGPPPWKNAESERDAPSGERDSEATKKATAPAPSKPDVTPPAAGKPAASKPEATSRKTPPPTPPQTPPARQRKPAVPPAAARAPESARPIPKPVPTADPAAKSKESGDAERDRFRKRGPRSRIR